MVLIYDNEQDVVASSAEKLTGVLKGGAASSGNTFKRIGPVSTYEAANGDLYVAHTIEVKGSDHPDGDPVVGFLLVHNGKVIRQIGLAGWRW